jgi:hypothetical protein
LIINLVGIYPVLVEACDMNSKKILHLGLGLTLLCGFSSNSMAQDEWTFGIGTGLMRLNAEGDMGFTAQIGAMNVPVFVKQDLDPDDFSDLIDSAFGFSFIAAKDKWRYTLAYGTLTLQADGPLNGGGFGSFEQDITFAETTAAYEFAETGANKFSVVGGIRNTEHDYDIRLSGTTLTRNGKLKQDWTDVLVGLAHSYAFSNTLVWDNQLVAGFGDSDSYSAFHTSLNWQFAKSWNAGVFVDYKAIDFENDSPGATDYYLYNADEFGPGLSIAYIF